MMIATFPHVLLNLGVVLISRPMPMPAWYYQARQNPAIHLVNPDTKRAFLCRPSQYSNNGIHDVFGTKTGDKHT